MGARILLVEDEESVRELVGTWLEDAGYKTIKAADGEQALRAFGESLPDLIILDIVMPRLDGIEFCKAVRQKHAIPILAMSGVATQVHMSDVLRAGADDYISKPFEMGDILARIEALIP